LLKNIIDYAGHKFRRLLQNYTIRSHKNKPWIRDVMKCQDEIATLNPHPKYLQSYRNQEIYYWLHIPKWIREDWSKHTIERCLDIGCAYGTLALYCKILFDCEVYCTDWVDTYLSPSLLKKYNFLFNVNNIELDPLPWDVKFDVIIFTEVLEHLNFHPVPTLKKIRDLLSEDGKLYLSTPDASQWGRVIKYYLYLDKIPFPKKGFPIIDDHVYQYNKNELFHILDFAGLDTCRFDYSPGVASRHFNLTLVRSRSCQEK
jgi:SAM-dependent methyltransferase